MRLLIAVAVSPEADALAALADESSVSIITTGVGRVNAGCAVTEALLRARERGAPFEIVLNVGVAGALPLVESSESGGSGESGGHASDSSSPLAFAAEIGAVILGTHAVYAEEGLMTPEGFRDMSGLGFPLLPGITGNVFPADQRLLARLDASLPAHLGIRAARLATVATCSGTDDRAREVVHRTGALAEAMEGAAVLHAAARLDTPALELRIISNTTGDRARQQWNLPHALTRLGPAAQSVVDQLLGR